MISFDKDVTAGFADAQAYGRGLAVFQHILGDVINFIGIEGLFAFDRDADVGDGEYLSNWHEISLHRSTAFMQAGASQNPLVAVVNTLGSQQPFAVQQLGRNPDARAVKNGP